MANEDESAPKGPKGNVKLIGIAGLVKGEQFSIGVGEEITIGRSRECELSLSRIPAALEVDAEELDKHFRTVSRTHMRLYYKAPDHVEVEDLSSNGLFLDGKRIEGIVVIEDLVTRPHELKLGTSETFALDFWRLVQKSKVKMVKVKTKGDGKAGEPEEESESEEGDKKSEKKDDKK